MATTMHERPAVATSVGAAGSTATEAAATPQRTANVDRPVAPVSAPRRAGPNFDHFLLAQLPLALAVALIVGIITFAALRVLPDGGTGGAPAAVGTGGALITAFSGAPVAQQVPVAADPTGALKWDKATYEAQAGDVTFVVTNQGVSTHNFAVEGGNVKAQGKNFGSNTTTTYTLKGLKAGEYLIVCNFPGHREAGMVARLIVK